MTNLMHPLQLFSSQCFEFKYVLRVSFFHNLYEFLSSCITYEYKVIMNAESRRLCNAVVVLLASNLEHGRAVVARTIKSLESSFGIYFRTLYLKNTN
jgi:hypothetical protein